MGPDLDESGGPMPVSVEGPRLLEELLYIRAHSIPKDLPLTGVPIRFQRTPLDG